MPLNIVVVKARSVILYVIKKLSLQVVYSLSDAWISLASLLLLEQSSQKLQSISELFDLRVVIEPLNNNHGLSVLIMLYCLFHWCFLLRFRLLQKLF